MTELLSDRLVVIRARLERHRSVGYPDTLFLLDTLDVKEKECFALAANQCHDGYAGEHGHHLCREVELKVAAETERCAKVAEQYECHYCIPAQSVHHHRKIAAAIRAKP